MPDAITGPEMPEGAFSGKQFLQPGDIVGKPIGAGSEVKRVEVKLMQAKDLREEIRKSVEHLMAAAESHGGGDDLVISLLGDTADLLSKRQSRGGALSTDQITYLMESGAFSSDDFADVEFGVMNGELANTERRTRLAAVTETQGAAEVAKRLGIDASRVRHRQSKGGLYAFMAGGNRRYPAWQFTGDPAQPVLPGLAAVVSAFPDDLHPATIQGFMTTRQSELSAGGEAMTPVEWLRHGGDTQAVVDILDSFLQS